MRFKRHHHLSCDLLHFLSFSRASHCKRPLVFYARHPFSFTLKCTSLFANFALFRLFCPSSFRIISTVSLSNEMDFEEILTKIGEFGLYQRKLFLFILLPYSFLSAWFHILPYFMISAPDHWCHVASLQHLPQTVQSKLIRPLEPDSSGQMNPSRCRMYDLDYQHLFATSGFINESAATAVFSSHRTNRTRPCSDGWQYDLSEFDETLVTHVISFFLTCLTTIDFSNQ